MARQNRIWYPGATYHVMSRGNWKKEIFREKSDYIRFLECIELIKEKYPFKIHAICLMTNHFHMLVETQTTNLSKIMQLILSLYVEEYNHKYNLSGHLFYGRYTAKLIEDDIYFLETSRYIHLNPVKALITNEPLEYQYSSYGYYVSDDANQLSAEEKMIKKLVEKDRIQGHFWNENAEGYRKFVESKYSHKDHETTIQKDMREDNKWIPWQKKASKKIKKEKHNGNSSKKHGNIRC